MSTAPESIRTRAVRAHRGIRYATAERFAPPRIVPFDPAAPAGDTSGPICPQAPGLLEGLLGMDVSGTSEDCLFLDVYTPADAAPDTALPVLVWIHGGAYLNGAGSLAWYDGTHLAARGQVVVTINYRLGALGYLGDGNYGTLDQIAALHWVRDHIAHFGGDPGNVTIFGESAGGSAVISLMAAPQTTGLFHRVWAMSPSINQLRDRASAAAWQQAFFEHAGISSFDEARELTVEQILTAQNAVTAMPNTNYDMFAPTAGGAALPVDSVAGLLAAVAANPVPLTLGTTRDESLLFLAFDPAMADAGTEQWEHYLERMFGARAPEVRAAYEAARPGASAVQLIAAVQTDLVFRRPAQRLAEARHDAGRPTWMYWFTWASPAFGGMLGSAHALDIPFAFDNLHVQGAEIMLGGGSGHDDVAVRYADEISAFAATGRARWDAFEVPARMTLRIDTVTEMIPDPEPALRLLHD